MEKPLKNTINDPTLFTQDSVIKNIQSGRSTVWRTQPKWKNRAVTFSTKDDTRRRALLRALTAPTASPDLQSLGYQIFMCEPEAQCGSPFCNYCRSTIEARYISRTKTYFANEKMTDLYWITILDDLTYDPINHIPGWVDPFRKRVKRAMKKSGLLEDAKLFGLIEIDAKKPSEMSDLKAASSVLRHYGLIANDDVSFMPHFHGILAVKNLPAKYVGDELRREFTKPSQIAVKPFFKNRTKTENLTELTKYMCKLRYMFSDNIKNGRPSYGSTIDPENLQALVKAVHDSKGDRGIRKFEISFNLK